MDDLRPISDFPGYYVDATGRIWSRRWILCKDVTRMSSDMRRLKDIRHSGTGYRFVWLRRDNRNHKRYVHRVVLEAFVGACPTDKHETRHINGIKEDNRLDNLAWGTHREQYEDKIIHGTSGKGRPSELCGEKHPMVKLTRAQAAEILALAYSESSGVLARRYGVSDSTILNIWKRRSWRCLDGYQGTL